MRTAEYEQKQLQAAEEAKEEAEQQLQETVEAIKAA